MTKKQGYATILMQLVFFIVILALVVSMTLKNSADLRGVLEESIQNQLVSTSVAARELLDVDAFVAYNDAGAAHLPEYQETLRQLRRLCANAGASYIYALKEVDGQFVFVFDTDTENEEIFIPYELFPVHVAAFWGQEAAGVMNVSDEYGSFNTGAVPIWKDGRIVGIVCTDTADAYMQKSLQTARFNAILLIGILVVTMGVMLILVIRLIRRIRAMQARLEHMAHYDNVTGLPNRQYLMDYLAKATADKKPFALFFIDLDNFKAVNDNAGHDAGDELLLHIAQYLDGALEDSKSFRPSAGILNIAARVGGDEFIQVIRDVDSEEKAGAIAQRLLDDFKSQHTDRYIDKYGVGLSIGVALYPYHTNNFHVLIKYADLAMYHAKNSGKNQYRLYADEMSQTEKPKGKGGAEEA